MMKNNPFPESLKILLNGIVVGKNWYYAASLGGKLMAFRK
jgi:hypothetical protein